MYTSLGISTCQVLAGEGGNKCIYGKRGGTILIHEVVFSAALTPECFYKSYKDRMSEGHDQ